MEQRDGLGLLGMAFLLGTLADGLLRATPWGINFSLWLLVAIAGGWAILPAERSRASAWPLAAALFFAACLAWRDTSFLQFWNSVAALGLLGLPVLETHRTPLRSTPIAGYVVGIARAGGDIVRGALAPLPPAIAWGHFVRYRGSVGAGAIGLGLSLPILAVFGTLLMVADAGFANLIRTVLHVNTGSLASHIAIIATVTWISAGYVYALIRRDARGAESDSRPSPAAPSMLGIVEIGVPLGALAALFATFLAVQASYLFGGPEAMIRAGLTYADYARQGFIELMFVSALLLPLLLGADWLFRPARVDHRNWFRRLVTCLLILTGALMASAFHRIALYVSEYGWSEIRLYASAFIVWVGLLHVAFATTVLGGRRQRFMFHAITSGIGVLGALNVVNPDAVIVRSQLHRYERTGEVDASYLARLSADAIPTLLTGTATLPAAARCTIEQARRTRWSYITHYDWRTWNASRTEARRALAATQGPNACPRP